MSNLTTCIRKAGALLNKDDKDAILERARALREEGLSPSKASAQAVSERLSQIETQAKDAEVAEREAGPGGVAATANIDAMAAESPDMMVTLPGEESPMRLADAMEKVRAQAQEMREDGDLFKAAAECALMSGA